MQTLDITAFRRAVDKSGLVLPDNIVRGQIIRFPGSGKSNGNKSGWAWVSEDGEAAAFGDWATGLSETWQAARSNTMTPTEQAAHTRRIAELRRARAEEERLRHEEAAKRAQAIWAEAKPPSDHLYLTKKHVRSHGLRVDEKGRLIVPVTIDGTITSTQSIDGTGAKLFQPGGAVKGGSYVIGDLTGAATVLICEGFATGASLHEATRFPVACALFAGNLISVAEQLRQQFPAATILICGDHDRSGTGQREASKAANEVKGLVVVPEIVGQDFNDVHVQVGLDAVRKAVDAAVPHHAPQGTGPDKGLVKELADTILVTDAFAQDAGGQLYVFETGAYRPHGEAHIARRVKSILVTNGDSKRWSSHRAREVFEFLRVDAPHVWDVPPADTLNVQNGLLDLATRTLRPHTPKHLSAVQLPVAYHPSATCATWEAFLSQVMPEDCQALAYELAALIMRPDPSCQQAVLCIGEGANGKSTFLAALTAFIGRENVSGLSLQRLEGDKFSVVRLLGKLANICPDLPSDHLTSTSTFKSLTGGDLITAERKFQASFEFISHARMIFSANHYPQSKDSSAAFFRRWGVFPFERTFAPTEQTPRRELDARLAQPMELSGVLNRALSALDGITRRGRLSQSESTRRAMMEFQEQTDPLAAWLDRFTTLNPPAITSKKDLHITYGSYADSSGRPPLSPKSFYSGVKRLRPTLTEAQRRVHGEVRDVFLGIEMKGPHASEASALSAHSAHSALPSQISLESEENRERGGKREKKLKGEDALNGLTPLTATGRSIHLEQRANSSSSSSQNDDHDGHEDEIPSSSCCLLRQEEVIDEA